MIKYPNNKYSQAEYERKIEVVKELNAIQDVYKFELIDDPTNDSRDYIQLIGETPIRVNFNTYSKEYSFYLHGFTSILPYVRYETQKKVSENYKEPNNVKVLTAKKVIDWITFLTQVYEDLLPISEERVRKVNEFEKKMLELNAYIGKHDPYGQFSGYVEKNGLELKFEVYDEAFISTRITVRAYQTVEDFIALADNKYKEKDE